MSLRAPYLPPPVLSGIHPDKGGSALLTTKVNEAKDILLKNKR